VSFESSGLVSGPDLILFCKYSVSNDRKNPSVSANPQPVHLDKSTPVTQDSHHRSTSSPLSDVDQTRAQSSVDPDFETTEQPSTLAGRRNTSKRPRGKAVSPSSSSEEKFERSPPPKKLNKGKGKAMEADEATEEEGDEDADPVRTKKISSASKRMKRMIIDEDTEDEVEIVSRIFLSNHSEFNPEALLTGSCTLGLGFQPHSGRGEHCRHRSSPSICRRTSRSKHLSLDSRQHQPYSFTYSRSRRR